MDCGWDGFRLVVARVATGLSRVGTRFRVVEQAFPGYIYMLREH